MIRPTWHIKAAVQRALDDLFRPRRWKRWPLSLSATISAQCSKIPFRASEAGLVYVGVAFGRRLAVPFVQVKPQGIALD